MKHLMALLLCSMAGFAHAQFLPDCTPAGMHSIYVLGEDNVIYRVDNVDAFPSAPVPVDSITAAVTEGLSIGNNLSGGAVSPTFYTTVQEEYVYRDQAGWVSSGHSTSTPAGNLGGGVRHIYNHRATSGGIYSYDGQGPATYIVLFTSSTSIYDVATDSLDNFYVVVTDANLMYKFDSLGNPLDTLQVTGLEPNTIQPGLTLLNGVFYAVVQVPVTNGLMRGTVVGNVVSFAQIAVLNIGSVVDDIAACPFQLAPVAVPPVEHPDQVVLFPNPASETMKIVASPEMGIQAVQVISDQGEVVYVDADFLQTPIPVAGLRNGMYVLKYTSGNRVVAKRFVVQH